MASGNNRRKEDKPSFGKRFRLNGLRNRDQYIVVDDEGVMVSFPDNAQENWNYQATATSLTRMISIAIRAGVGTEIIKKQLRESSMQARDTPDLILTAIERYENEDNE